MKKKNNGYTKQFRSDSPDTYLTDVNQQKAMLVELLDAETERNNKKISQIQRRINTYVEPQINKDLDQFAESRARYEALRNKSKTPEKIEKKNFGLAGILQVSKRIKD